MTGTRPDHLAACDVAGAVAAALEPCVVAGGAAGVVAAGGVAGGVPVPRVVEPATRGGGVGTGSSLLHPPAAEAISNPVPMKIIALAAAAFMPGSLTIRRLPVVGPPCGLPRRLLHRLRRLVDLSRGTTS